MRGRSAFRLLAILFFAPSSTLHAQLPGPAHFETWRPPPSELLPATLPTDTSQAATNTSGMLLGGVTGWVVGWAAGALVGSTLVCGTDSSECGFGPGIAGALLAGSFTIPAGVHLGNHGRGDLLKGVLVSAAIGGLGIAVGSSVDDTGLWLLFVPIGQIIGSVWMETKSTRDKEGRTED